MITINQCKDAEIRFRVPSHMKDDFLRMCRNRDVPASHLLRRFVRSALVARVPDMDDEIRQRPVSVYDCPRCGASEVGDINGFNLCQECRLVWRTLPSPEPVYDNQKGGMKR
ncbi:MAG: hypothetical protein RQ867_05920 [Mariprofundaceae bacterium]|nr:hypothetical protein [Mariprofundaceae bacterium]